jgi:predicted AAA+ superfamily ATPase
MDGHVPRLVEAEIAEFTADGVTAIALDGAKGVGKTRSAFQFADRAFELDQPQGLERFLADPARAMSQPGTVLIDEWQRYPASWDMVRRAVDEGVPGRRFVLTGSATEKSGSIHSGAGRIVSVRMRPMTLVERGLPASVSLAALLAGGRPPVEAETDVDLGAYVEQITRGGFPGMARLRGRGLRSQLDGYLARIVDREVPDGGLKLRQPDKLHRWLRAYAAATATTASYESIRDAASPGEGEKVTKVTALGYRDVLESIWVLDPIPAWLGSSTQLLHNLGQAPKHHLVDPALAVRALGMTGEGLLEGAEPDLRVGRRTGMFLGALLESLVALNLRVYAQSSEAQVRHLRTHGGEHEVDFIVERADGRVVAVEVKLSATVDGADVRHLHWLQESLGDRLLDAVIVTTGRHAYRRADGIAVVPVALLGP